MLYKGKPGTSLIIALISTAILIIVSFFFLVLEAERSERETAQTLTTSAAGNLTARFEKVIVGLSGIRAFFLGSIEVTPEEFSIYAASVRSLLPSLTAIEWVDEQNIVRYVYPLEGDNLKAVNFDNNPFPNRLLPITAAKESRSPNVSEPIILVQGFPGLIVYVPIFKEETYRGAVVGVIKLSAFFDDLPKVIDPQMFAVQVQAGKKLLNVDAASIYTTDGKRIIDAAGKTVDDPNSLKLLDDATTAELDFGNQQWLLLMHSRQPLMLHVYAIGALGVFVVLMNALLGLLLYSQKAKLEEAYRRERDFAALVSHQLRIPLTELSWMLETVFETSTDMTPERAETIQEIRGIIRNSTGLINDLLDISKIERGVLQLKCEEVSIADLVKETEKILERQAREKGVALTLDIPEKMIVVADRQKAIEALRNVIDNAIKYAPIRTFVEVAAEESLDAVTISVKDQGPGISADIRPKLFDKSSMFSKKGPKEGSGLGLYLTKQFVELMGGRVRFETSSKGTTFFITLPKEGSGQCEPTA